LLSALAEARPGRDPVLLLLDHEPQRAGKDEVATALRLPERVIGSHPRGFDLVMADALHSTAPLFNFLLTRGKHALTVLKWVSTLPEQSVSTGRAVAFGHQRWDLVG
jgi:hypothetical protein